MKAIVVDDSTVIRRLIAGFLYAQGFDLVLEGKNGVEALQHLAGDQIADLIVLDVNMPAMSGWQLVHLLDGKPRFAAMKIVLLTADDMTRFPALDRVDACVPKPFTPAKMQAVLTSLGFPVMAAAPAALAV